MWPWGLERVIKMSHVKKGFVIFDILGLRRKFFLFSKFEGKNSIIHKPEVKTTNQLLPIKKFGEIFSTNKYKILVQKCP